MTQSEKLQKIQDFLRDVEHTALRHDMKIYVHQINLVHVGSNTSIKFTVLLEEVVNG